jgi:ankyrin repeat protein
VLKLLLLQASVPCDEFRDSQGRSILHLGAVHGAGDVVALALKHQIPPNEQDLLGRTALHEACASQAGGEEHIIRMLMAAGSDPNLVDHHGFVAWYRPAVAGLDQHSSDEQDQYLADLIRECSTVPLMTLAETKQCCDDTDTHSPRRRFSCF